MDETDATITLTSNGTTPPDGVTVTLGNKVYTAKTALAPTEGEVLIGGTAAAFLDNLKAAVNHTGTPDTDYSCAAAHTQITATTNTDTTQLFVASVGAASGRAGNDIAASDSSATLSWSNSGAFSGGLDGTLVNALVDSTDLADTDSTGLVQNLTLKATAEVISGGNALMLHIRTGASATTDLKDVDIEYSVV